MNNGLMRVVAMLLAATLLTATLAAPVHASGDGNGQDQYRSAFVFWALGKTIAKGNSPGALDVHAYLFVQQKIHAMAVLVYAGPLVLGQLEQLTGKAIWTASVYLAILGVFYRQIMLQFMAQYMHPLFVVWCMLLYMITNTNTFATE